MKKGSAPALVSLWRLTAACLASAMLIAAGGLERSEAKPNPFQFYNISNAELNGPPGTLVRSQPLALPPFYRAKAWRILYVTRDYAGRPIASSGVVVVSDYVRDSRRMVAWAHPTSGVARKCAPSLRKSPIEAIEGIKELIGGGFIVTATDYPGLGTPGPMGYLVGLGQARAIIDSVRAARQLLDLRNENRFALWGYSQGGHAVLFAANHAPAYAPELSLVGVAAAAPPTNLPSLFLANYGSVEGRILIAMTLASWSKKYVLPLTSIATPASLPAIEQTAAQCVDDLGSQLDALFAQKPLEKAFLDRNPVSTPPWSALLQQNSVNGMRGGVPVFIAQGTNDQLVRNKVTLDFVRNVCRTGTKLKYVSLQNVGHGKTAERSAAAAVGWIADRFAGKSAPSSCR